MCSTAHSGLTKHIFIAKRPLIPAGTISVAVAVTALGALALLALSHLNYRFLWDSTNWAIGFSLLEFSASDPYWWAFLVGVSNTLLAGGSAVILATLLGFVLGLVRSSSNPVLAAIIRFYTDVIRNIPVILQAMFWYAVYLGLPAARSPIEFLGARLSNRGFYFPWFDDPAVVFGFAVGLIAVIVGGLFIRSRVQQRTFRPDPRSALALMVAAGGIGTLAATIPGLPESAGLNWPESQGLGIRGGMRVPIELAALVTALTIYRAAYIAEVFRAGFRSISRDHLDASHALSLSPWITLTRIRIPLALITILPPLTSEFIVIMKVSSIGLLVGFNDLYAVSVNATTLTGMTLEIMALMTLGYLVINFTIAQCMNAFNRRIAFRGGKPRVER